MTIGSRPRALSGARDTPYRQSPLRSSFSAEDLHQASILHRKSESDSDSDWGFDDEFEDDDDQDDNDKLPAPASHSPKRTTTSTRRMTSYTSTHKRRDSKLDEILKATAQGSPRRNNSIAPTRRSDNDDDDDDEEKQGLLDQIVPEPTQPRAWYTTSATGVLTLFFLFVFVHAFVVKPPPLAPSGADSLQQDQMATEKGTSWFNYDWVPWKSGGQNEGVNDSEGSNEKQEIQAWSTTSPNDGDADANTVAATDEPQTSVPVDEVEHTQTSSTTSVTGSATVAALLADGSISDYKWHHTLVNWIKPRSEQGRLVFIGDIHGMTQSLDAMLDKLTFSEMDDSLVFVGDLVAKSSVSSSIATVKRLREMGAVGVRGNNDQGVIAWRRWMEAYGRRTSSASTEEAAYAVGKAHETLKTNLGDADASEDLTEDRVRLTSRAQDDDEEEESEGSSDDGHNVQDEGSKAVLDSPLATFGSDSDDGSLQGIGWGWLDAKESKLDSMGIKVPDGWNWASDWFEIARAMPKEDFEWLAGLPLTLWIDEIKTYVVHAGMVPSTSSSQEAFTSSAEQSRPSSIASTSLLRFEPSSQLRDVLSSSSIGNLLLAEPNTDPFTLLNMRTIKMRKPQGVDAKHSDSTEEDSYVPSKSKKGIPWFDVFNAAMQQCSQAPDGPRCESVNVVYGHWAGKGLTVNDFTVGLDSACVFGKQLTALVLDKSDIVNDESETVVSRPVVEDDVPEGDELDSYRKFGAEDRIEPSDRPEPLTGGLRDGDKSNKMRRVKRQSTGEDSPSDELIQFAGVAARLISVDCAEEAMSYHE
ncbi:hypothetical protein OIO90_003678 [Microbotryomycetes sp. JL221]|nr:hypothetical protein OIO90_003678 [Microbotryomycetes sp. JL221]